MEVESDGIRKSNLFEDNPFEVQSLYSLKINCCDSETKALWAKKSQNKKVKAQDKDKAETKE